jgi:aryl-alcohol dehydrogenase-like predicted oxidoreductase
MQDHFNLLAREEERKMLPLCADEGVGTIVWSPVARGRLARAWNEPTARPPPPPGAPPERRSAWPGCARNPAVVAPLVGASGTAQIEDAVASLDIELTHQEAAALESLYTPRYDF